MEKKYRGACMINAETGVVIYKFSDKEVALGRTYMIATARAMAYTITGESSYYDFLTLACL